MLYDELKKREDDIRELASLGVISDKYIRNIRIFERFHTLVLNGCKRYRAYKIIANDDDALSWQMIRTIINDLSS